MGVTLKFTYPVKVFKRFIIVMFIGIYTYGQKIIKATLMQI